MATEAPSLMDSRRHQMFPVLETHDIERLRRFGEVRYYPAGSVIVKAGEISPGLIFVLKGLVAVTQGGEFGQRLAIVEHGPGSFSGELAQLSDRPALVDAVAREAVEAIVVAPRRLRDVLVQEAELGERIMRALILRRVGLLQAGESGPIIIGVTGSSDVLRLEGFLRRNGHPYKTARRRDGWLRPHPAAALRHRARAIAHRAVSRRPVAAQSRRERTGALHRPGAGDRSRRGL